MSRVFHAFYAVRHNGKYFHRRGYGGIGEQWVDDLVKATIYTKRGQALSRVTWYARNAGFTPELIRLSVEVDGVEDVTKHVEKALKKPSSAFRRELSDRRRDYERAKAAYDQVRRVG